MTITNVRTKHKRGGFFGQSSRFYNLENSKFTYSSAQGLGYRNPSNGSQISLYNTINRENIKMIKKEKNITTTTTTSSNDVFNNLINDNFNTVFVNDENQYEFAQNYTELVEGKKTLIPMDLRILKEIDSDNIYKNQQNKFVQDSTQADITYSNIRIFTNIQSNNDKIKVLAKYLIADYIFFPDDSNTNTTIENPYDDSNNPEPINLITDILNSTTDNFIYLSVIYKSQDLGETASNDDNEKEILISHKDNSITVKSYIFGKRKVANNENVDFIEIKLLSNKSEYTNDPPVIYSNNGWNRLEKNLYQDKNSGYNIYLPNTMIAPGGWHPLEYIISEIVK
jgi:hypothetical protein